MRKRIGTTRLVAITVLLTFVIATAIGVTGLIGQQANVALGSTTTLSIIQGGVIGQDPSGERALRDGELLQAGMTLTTGPDTYAVITYFEGSTVSIDPNTTLTIESLNANPDGTTSIVIQQAIGRTWHSVQKLLGGGSKYEVRTPTGTASVRGTLFEVGVQTDEQGELTTTVETTEGAVATKKEPTAQDPQPSGEVLVTPGFKTEVKASQPLKTPEKAPEPERRVTVTVGSDTGLVVDPVGRANGFKDGKLVIQTPGATVKRVDGKLVVIMPNIPDGNVATVVDGSDTATTDVETKVNEKGKSEQKAVVTIEKRDPKAEGPAVARITVSKGDKTITVVPTSGGAVKEVTDAIRVGGDNKTDDKAKDEDKDKTKDGGSTGAGGSAGTGTGSTTSTGSSGDKKDDKSDKKDERTSTPPKDTKDTRGSTGSTGSGFVPDVKLAPIPVTPAKNEPAKNEPAKNEPAKDKTTPEKNAPEKPDAKNDAKDDRGKKP